MAYIPFPEEAKETSANDLGKVLVLSPVGTAYMLAVRDKYRKPVQLVGGALLKYITLQTNTRTF